MRHRRVLTSYSDLKFHGKRYLALFLHRRSKDNLCRIVESDWAKSVCASSGKLLLCNHALKSRMH